MTQPISSWSLRGAISGSLYGYSRPGNFAVNFYMLPIDADTTLLPDFTQFVPECLIGLRRLMDKLPDTLSQAEVIDVVKQVFAHFRFYEYYKARGGKRQIYLSPVILTSGLLFVQRFKSALLALGIDHGVSDSIPEGTYSVSSPITSVPSTSAPSTSAPSTSASSTDLAGADSGMFSVLRFPSLSSNVRNTDIDKLDKVTAVEVGVDALQLLTDTAPTKVVVTPELAKKRLEARIIHKKRLELRRRRHSELTEDIKMYRSRIYGAQYNPYNHVPSHSVADGGFLTESLENMLWPSSKREPARSSIKFEEEPCQGDEMKKGEDSFLGIGIGEKRGTSVGADVAGGGDDPARKKARPQDDGNSDFLIDEFNMAMGDCLDSDDDYSVLSQDDEKQPSVDVIIQLLQNEDLKNRVKNVLKPFVEIDECSNEKELSESLSQHSGEELRCILDSCLAKVSSSEEDEDESEQSCSSKTDDPMLRKSSDRKEKCESIDMIVEFLDNPKLRKTVGCFDQELAKTVTSEGFSCKEVRAHLHTLSINQVKLVLEKCLNVIESEGIISEPDTQSEDVETTTCEKGEMNSTDKEHPDKMINIKMITELLEDEEKRPLAAAMVPSLKPFLDFYNTNRKSSFATEFQNFLLNSFTVSELGRMTVDFMDIKPTFFSTFPKKDHNASQRSEPVLNPDHVALICDREDNADETYVFSKNNPLPSCITGEPLYDKLVQALPVDINHPYIRVVADGNAIAENSPESFAQLCDDIKNRDTSLLVGIDVLKFRPRFRRYRMPTSCSDKLPAILSDILETVISPSEIQTHSDIERVDYIEASSEIVTAFYEKKRQLAEAGNKAEIILYHGTDANNVGLIFTENFRLDLTPLTRPKGSAHGKGIYFSLDLPTAMSYGYKGVVIASRVLIGNIGINADTKIASHIYVVKSADQILPFCVLNLKAKQHNSLFFLPRTFKYITSQSRAALPPYNVAYTTAHGRMYRSVTSVTAEAELCAVCNRSVAEPSVLSKDPEAVDAKWFITLSGCSHKLHKYCLSSVRGLTSSSAIKCPSCSKETLATFTGFQPSNGTMSVCESSLAFHPSYTGTVIAITFAFRDGSGYKALGFPRMAFLPGTDQGRRVLELLKEAFKRCHLFWVCQYQDDGAAVLDWGPIVLKKSLEELSEYDPQYLSRVENELRQIGVCN